LHNIILSINFNSNVDLENILYNNKIDKLNIKNKYIIFITKIEQSIASTEWLSKKSYKLLFVNVKLSFGDGI
jgi:hypothetical protein